MNLESDPATTIPFGHGIFLRRFTDDELTLLYGGIIAGGQRWRTPTWGFVGDFEDVKHIGVVDIDTAMSDYPLVIPRLERAVLSLRTFKGGAVGIEAVHFVPIGFHPMGLSIARTEFHEFVPFGHYGISEAEVADLTEHAELMNATLHPSMEMVASRLAFASTRTHSSDRILDAVIGLEGVLLAQIGEDVRGENRFRFSLNYAMLSGEPAARVKDFRLAKQLYDLRSKIAHGGVVDDERVRVGSERISLNAAAAVATEALRRVFRRFLPAAAKPPYLDASFWESLYFH